MLDGLSMEVLGDALLREIHMRMRADDLAVEVVALYLVGSRVRGCHCVDSDIDVIMVYEGACCEDDIFNAVNALPIWVEDIVVDIDPRPEFEPNGPYIRLI